jgi:hypothetical protein
MTDSSTVENNSATPEASPSEPVSDVNQSTPVSSTGDEGVKSPTSVLDAVTAALVQKASDGVSPPSKDKGSTASATASDPAAGDPAKPEDPLGEIKISPEELAAQKPQTRQRMEQLLGTIKELKSQTTALSERAQQYDSVLSFVDRHGITPEDWKSGLEVMALMKGDPVQAWERLQPIVSHLQAYIGNVLPPELQRRVDLGYISEPDARALNQAQRREAITRETVQERDQRAAEQREQDSVRGVVRDVTSTVTAWENAKKSSDPDWHLKEPRINQLVRLEVYEKGYPNTKAAALKMVEGIHETVTKELRTLTPKPNTVRPAHGAGTSSPTAAEPKSLLEAIRLGINRKTA